MRVVLGGWVRILAASWPRLLAWYLIGNVARSSVLALAAPLGGKATLAALLLVPIAILARLISYVGMFLVARTAMRTYRGLLGADHEPVGFIASAREFFAVLSAAVIPFFVFYDLIGGVQSDIDDYAREAFRQAGFGGNSQVLDVGSGPLVIAVFLGALIARILLQRLGDRLPSGFALADIYLDSVWVFVGVNGLNSFAAPIVDWVERRQIVAAFLDLRAQLTELWTGFKVALDGIGAIIPIAAQLVLLPLAWLLIAGIVYSRSLADLTEQPALPQRVVPQRLEEGVRSRTAGLPRPIRILLSIPADEWEEKGVPILVSARIAVRSGLIGLAALAGASALIFAAQQWLVRGVAAVVIGPHPERFWLTLYPVVFIAVAAITEPIRFALLASAFDAALGRRQARLGPAGVRAEVAPAADTLDRDAENPEAAVADAGRADPTRLDQDEIFGEISDVRETPAG